MSEYLVNPEYHPIVGESDTSNTSILYNQTNVILPYVRVPVKSLFGITSYNDTSDLSIEASHNGINSVKLTWKPQTYNRFKVIYSLDGKNVIESKYLFDPYYEILYSSDTSILYVGVVICGAEELYSQANFVSIFCTTTENVENTSYNLVKNEITSSSSVVYGDFEKSEIFSAQFSYLSDRRIQIEIDSSREDKRKLIRYNETVSKVSSQIEIELAPHIKTAILPLDVSIAYDIYVSSEDDSGEFSSGNLYRFYYESISESETSVNFEKYKNYFPSELMQDSNILSEFVRILSHYTDEIESNDFVKHDVTTLNKEYSLSRSSFNSLYKVDNIELLKPLSSFKGTISDLEYQAKLYSSLALTIYKPYRIPKKLNSIKHLLPSIDTRNLSVRTLCKINNGNPFKINNARSNKPLQECAGSETVSIDRSRCYYDSVMVLNLDGTIDNIALIDFTENIHKFFKARMFVCMSMRLVTVILKLTDTYFDDQDDAFKYIAEQYVSDAFPEIYAGKINNHNPKKIVNKSVPKHNNLALIDRASYDISHGFYEEGIFDHLYHNFYQINNATPFGSINNNFPEKHLRLEEAQYYEISPYISDEYMDDQEDSTSYDSSFVSVADSFLKVYAPKIDNETPFGKIDNANPIRHDVTITEKVEYQVLVDGVITETLLR